MSGSDVRSTHRGRIGVMAIRRFKNVAAIAGVVVLILAGIFCYVVWATATWADHPNALADPVTVDVVPGTDFGQIANQR